MINLNIAINLAIKKFFRHRFLKASLRSFSVISKLYMINALIALIW